MSRSDRTRFTRKVRWPAAVPATRYQVLFLTTSPRGCTVRDERAPVPTAVVQLDLHTFDHGALERFEMVGRRGHRVVPARGVMDDRSGGGLGVLAEGRREGVHQLAESRPDLGCGAGRAGDEEERAGLVGGQPAQVGSGPADQLPAAATSGLGVHGDPGHGEALEVAAGGSLADLELARPARRR